MTFRSSRRRQPLIPPSRLRPPAPLDLERDRTRTDRPAPDGAQGTDPTGITDGSADDQRPSALAPVPPQEDPGTAEPVALGTASDSVVVPDGVEDPAAHAASSTSTAPAADPHPAAPTAIEPEPVTPTGVEPHPLPPAATEPEPIASAMAESAPDTTAPAEPEPDTTAPAGPEAHTTAQAGPEPDTTAPVGPEPVASAAAGTDAAAAPSSPDDAEAPVPPPESGQQPAAPGTSGPSPHIEELRAGPDRRRPAVADPGHRPPVATVAPRSNRRRWRRTAGRTPRAWSPRPSGQVGRVGAVVLLTFLIAAFVVLVALNIARIQQQDAAAGQAGTSTAPAAPDTVRPHARPVVTVLGGATGDGFGVLPAKSLLSPELAGDITVRPTKGARYVQGAGTSGSTFESLARTAIPGSAAVVLYSGQHDRGDPLPALASAATRAVAAAKARCPGAAVVLVGPVWRPDEQPPEDIQILRSTLRSVATAAKAQWVDPIGQHWIPNRPGMVDSQGDLTSAARQALAAALGKAVAPHLG